MLGGSGSDILLGGKQKDYFVLQTGAGVDLILDFGVGRDCLVLSLDLDVDDLKLIERRRGVLLKASNDKLAWVIRYTVFTAIATDVPELES